MRCGQIAFGKEIQRLGDKPDVSTSLAVEAVDDSPSRRPGWHAAFNNLGASEVVHDAINSERSFTGHSFRIRGVNLSFRDKLLIEVELIVAEIADPIALPETGSQSLVRGIGHVAPVDSGGVKAFSAHILGHRRNSVIPSHRDNRVGKPDLFVDVTEQVRDHPVQPDVSVQDLLAVGSVSVTGEVGRRKAYRKQVRELVGAKRFTLDSRLAELGEVLSGEGSVLQSGVKLRTRVFLA